VDLSRFRRCALHVALLGKPGGCSGCARPIPLMLWRCILAHEPGAPHQPASPPKLPLCSAFWRLARARPRTRHARSRARSHFVLSASRPRVARSAGVCLPPSQTTLWKILRLFGCIAQEDRRRKPKALELRQPGEEVQFDWQPMEVTSLLIRRASESRVVEIANCLSRSIGKPLRARSGPMGR
jgi:hypothetical protein